MGKLSSPPNKLPEPTTERPVPPLPPKKPEQIPSATPASIPSREDSGPVEQEGEAKFKAAEAKAKREGVEALTSEDIDGLSLEQIKNSGATRYRGNPGPGGAPESLLVS